MPGVLPERVSPFGLELGIDLALLTRPGLFPDLRWIRVLFPDLRWIFPHRLTRMGWLTTLKTRFSIPELRWNAQGVHTAGRSRPAERAARQHATALAARGRVARLQNEATGQAALDGIGAVAQAVHRPIPRFFAGATRAETFLAAAGRGRQNRAGGVGPDLKGIRHK